MQHGTYRQQRSRIIWEERKTREAIIDEFFRAYDAARRANRVFRDDMTTSSTSQPIPACLATLNLALPCTVQDVKHAFRLKAKTAHPDTGGSNEAFQTLHRAYQEALALVNG